MKRRFAITTVCLGLTAVPAFAIFGFGDIVFDPTSYGELVEQLTQLQQQYAQLVKTYNIVTSQYNQMMINAKWIAANPA